MEEIDSYINSLMFAGACMSAKNRVYRRDWGRVINCIVEILTSN